MNIEEMLAREAIRYTVGVYNSAVDRGDYNDLRKVFVPDGIMNFNGTIEFVGHDDIVAGLEAGAKKRGAFEAGNYQRHIVGQGMIKVVDQHTAKAVHFAILVSEIGVDNAGVYVDEFVRSGDRWLIQRRQATVEWAHSSSRFASFPAATTPCRAPDLNLWF